MLQLVGLLLLGPAAWAQQYAGCPEPYGVQTYPHETYCDKFYKCVNGRAPCWLYVEVYWPRCPCIFREYGDAT